MRILHLNSHALSSLSLSSSSNFLQDSKPHKAFKACNHLSFSRMKIKAVGMVSSGGGSEPEAIVSSEEPPSIDFAFVSSVLLPDGTPDIHIRSARGGQKLRDIMLDNNIDLYGPYARPLLNCAGTGTCGTCIVEVVEGKELLSLRTDKEKEKLKRKPKNWRLACQTTVGKEDSRGEVVIQQLPEWKGHEWSNPRTDKPR
ncbi:photosynthetic NDH subunit of subcomplex B 3, chloroplastic isoform X2 [Macadamia integrifolia]|uniref:photosynthetic NDH subunit of subcomplex B 3, chloroplastic isoform X2 n=1 Tax=Macadamia integrifolia TaxID=60698 RepID=UPI001C4EACC9|nr:photosynthetic NDH subunit of subcomplex B 3, chloroplastic isoform X2 [Macadamia integrifolia]